MTFLETTFLIIYLMFFAFFVIGLIKLSIDYKKYSKERVSCSGCKLSCTACNVNRFNGLHRLWILNYF